jgi:hypothetical protein
MTADRAALQNIEQDTKLTEETTHRAALVERLEDAAGYASKEHAAIMREASAAISLIRAEGHYAAAAEIERLRAENASLASWQCEFTDGKTGLVYSEGGGTYCAMAKENERLRSALKDIIILSDAVFPFSGLARAALAEEKQDD